MSQKKFIKKAIKKPGALEALAKREKGLNKDGSISVTWARKKLKDPKTSTKVKQRINFFLNVLKPASEKKAKKSRAKNPVPQGKLAKAEDLYRRFRDENPRQVDEVMIEIPKVGIIIGELDFVGYTTRRSGKMEKYIHKFKRGSKPTLCASHDGDQIFIVGGNYHFTELGIEDL